MCQKSPVLPIAFRNNDSKLTLKTTFLIHALILLRCSNLSLFNCCLLALQVVHDSLKNDHMVITSRQPQRAVMANCTRNNLCVTHVSNSTLDEVENGTGISVILRQNFPKYMIIGFAKSGTKALFEVLKIHPSLSGPTREPRFFSLHYESGLASYLHYIPSPPRGNFTIEKSADYIIHPLAAQRILNSTRAIGVDPFGLKFIVLLRNPIDRMMSDYLEWSASNKFRGLKPLRPFVKQVLTDNGTVNSHCMFLNTSCYSYHICRWLRVFSPKQMCFVDGDKFISQPYTEVKRLEKCLDLTPFFTPEHFVYKNDRGFYCFTRQNIYLCMNRNKGRWHPPIPANVTDKLKAFFRPWNEQLLSLTGRNFSDWT